MRTIEKMRTMAIVIHQKGLTVEQNLKPRPLKKATQFRHCVVCGRHRTVPVKAAQLCDICMADTALAVEVLGADVDRLARHWGSLADASTESDQHRFGKMLEAWSDAKRGTTLDIATKYSRFKHRLSQTVAEATPFTELVHAWWEWTLRQEDAMTLTIQLVVMADDEVKR